jgi:bla regulator protein blaR1
MSMRARLSVAAAGLMLLGSAVFGQTSVPAFEVVSIKPLSGTPVLAQGPAPPDRFVRANTTVVDLIRYAHGYQDFQIEGGPEWVRSSRYEVSAKAESAQTAEQMQRMVQRLLADRFGLRTHTETRELSTYALVTARKDGRLGDRLRASSLDCAAMIDAGKVVMPKPGGPPSQCFWFIATMNGLNRMRVDGIRMSRFITLLEPMAQRKIADKTGLSGTYDLDLEFLPDRGLPIGPPPPGTTPATDTPALLTALQDQLGLKLESARGPVEILVIDSAEPPTPN